MTHPSLIQNCAESALKTCIDLLFVVWLDIRSQFLGTEFLFSRLAQRKLAERHPLCRTGLKPRYASVLSTGAIPLFITLSFNLWRKHHGHSPSPVGIVIAEIAIPEPKKVPRCALKNARCIAGLMLTTEAMVAELPKMEKPAMPAGGMDDYWSTPRSGKRWETPLPTAVP